MTFHFSWCVPEEWHHLAEFYFQFGTLDEQLVCGVLVAGFGFYLEWRIER